MILPFLIAWLASRINRHQDHVIRYLREENRILKAKLRGRRMQLTDTERRRLAVLAHSIERTQLKGLSTVATPDTLRHWYRRLVVQASSQSPQGKSLGRPRVALEIEQLAVRMANENPRWGYRRIQGALSNLGYHIDNTTVRNILRWKHIDPVPIRGKAGISWSLFVKLHLEVLAASGFFEPALSTFTCLQTVVTQLGRHLNTRGVQLLSVIRHGAMSALARLVQPCRTLWAVCLTPFASQWRVVFDRRRRVPDGVLPTLRLASLQAVRQTMPPQVQPEREPSAAKRPERVIILLERSRDARISGARFLSPSRADRVSHQLRSQHQYGRSFPDANLAAA